MDSKIREKITALLREEMGPALGVTEPAAIAERENIDEEKLVKSIALSYLVTIYIKEHSGRLSAFCGVPLQQVQV